MKVSESDILNASILLVDDQQGNIDPLRQLLGDEMLYEPGGQLQHAYFPTTAIVSLHYVTESGSSCEAAAGLEAGACECYAVVKEELSRLLSGVREIH